MIIHTQKVELKLYLLQDDFSSQIFLDQKLVTEIPFFICKNLVLWLELSVGINANQTIKGEKKNNYINFSSKALLVCLI